MREKAENKGFSARATSEGRRRKRSTEEAESAESLLIGTRATDVGGRENHGKLACLPERMGAKKRSYASAIIGEEMPQRPPQMQLRESLLIGLATPITGRNRPGSSHRSARSTPCQLFHSQFEDGECAWASSACSRA